MAGFPFLEDLVTPLETFTRQIAELAARWRVLPLAEIVSHLREGKRLPAGAVGITFDDGYADNCEFALPVLRRYRLPATVFLATGHLEGARGLFWWDEVSRWRALGARKVGIPGLGSRSLASMRDRDRLLAELQRLPVDETLRMVRGASTRPPVPPAEPAGPEFLTWDQVREMQSSGVDIGAHTVRHAFLPAETVERRREELAESRARIERETGTACRHFAYPYGAVTPGIAREVRDAGFEAAVSTRVRDLAAGEDLFLLPRKTINHKVGVTVLRFRLTRHPERIKGLLGLAAGDAA
jgi:peptidoglycan/xylan/chitin deacetylase (PgdA/CDA1 family)